MSGALERLPDAPYDNALVDQDRGMSGPWREWFYLALVQRLQTAPTADPVVHLAGQHAAIGATALVPSATAGIYRVNWRLRVTTPDGVASSVAVTILSVDAGVNVSQPGDALTSDAVNVALSGEMIVRTDASSPISYAVAYASTTPAQMAFMLDLVCEALG